MPCSHNSCDSINSHKTRKVRPEKYLLVPSNEEFQESGPSIMPHHSSDEEEAYPITGGATF